MPSIDVPDVASPLLSWRRGETPASFSPFTSPCGCASLSVTPHALRDSWSTTFYTPLLKKDDLAALLASVPPSEEVTIDVSCSMQCGAQFDQVGIFVTCGEGTFIKAGLELSDGTPRLSVVVTNSGFSDWSTQAWPRFSGGVAGVRLRLHKLHPPQGPCVLIEADTGGDDPLHTCPKSTRASPEWAFVRIAPLHAPAGAPWGVGVFSAAPVAAGTVASFSHASIGPRAPLSHSPDASAML